MEPTQEEIDRVFAALADATRRDVLARVIDREQSVSSLARPYAMSLPAVQKHDAVLERAGLVGRTRVGREQHVHAVPERIRVAGALLDRLELRWRLRVDAMDRLLAEEAVPNGPVQQEKE
ncbi:metalloregulator ArsR/SmtB family transcription factor [Amnibacterium soli]|uniref:Metalloregulator ArsR/SmtB family transcription factor n=1 Tax=Amnibacterium soli TaxID=1282736 RepID=A0ABP8YZ02_9MICO